MVTKVFKKRKLAMIPAGIIEGTEMFWYNNEKWVLHEGHAMPFHDAPGKVQRMIADAFLNDTRSRDYLKKTGIYKFSEGFEMWYKCVVGGLDYVPDFLNGEFTPDQFNNTCTDYHCPHRGKLCSMDTGLKNYEVETIVALKEGRSIAATAAVLFVSEAAVKSRIEKINYKLGTCNMASMIARAVELGI